MNTKYLKTLEYDKIIHKLSTYCKTYIGKENVHTIVPEFSTTKVTDLLKFTSEAISLIYRKGNLPISDIPNISVSIKNLESNRILSSLALLNLARFLKISREVKEYFFSDNIDLAVYTKTYDLFDLIYTNKNMRKLHTLSF